MEQKLYIHTKLPVEEKEKKTKKRRRRKKEKEKKNRYLADYGNFCQSTTLDRETDEYYEQQLGEMQNHGRPLHQLAGISNEATPRVN